MSSAALLLSVIARGWLPQRVKHVSSKIGSGKTPSGGSAAYIEEGVVFIRSQNVYDDGLRLNDVVFIDEATDHEMAGTRVRTGDVLLNITGASIGRCTSVPTSLGRANVNQHVCIIRPRNVEGRYLTYALQSYVTKEQVLAGENGSSREGLNFQQVGNLVFANPPSARTQRAIADFLDKKTAAIDALIAKKERLIELLQEKRQALITQAVTKGLDPDVPKKHSGVEWLGEIPAHWEVSRPKHLCTKIIDGPHHTPEYVDEGVPFVTVRNLTAGEAISFEDIKYISARDHSEFVRRANPQRGDVLITKDGTLGVTRVVETDQTFSIFVSVALLKLKRCDVDPFFMRYVLESRPTWLQFTAGADGAALKHIVLKTIGNVLIPLPPLEEQRAIADAVRRRASRVAALEQRVRTHVELLREYRQALITGAVTGKLDIAQEAACEPETVVGETLEAAP